MASKGKSALSMLATWAAVKTVPSLMRSRTSRSVVPSAAKSGGYSLKEASRRAINQVVQVVAIRAAKTQWTGRVVDYDGQEMFINAGAAAGLQAGDQFMIEHVTKKLTDPETGQLLSVRKNEIGTLRLTGVEETVSYGAYSPLEQDVPQRGDWVSVIDY